MAADANDDLPPVKEISLLDQIENLLGQYDRALAVATFHRPGARWLVTLFVTQQARRVLTEVHARLTRLVALRDDDDAKRSSDLIARYLPGVPQPGGQRTVVVCFLTGFAVLVAVVNGRWGSNYLSIFSSAVTFDAEGLSEAVAGMDTVHLLQNMLLLVLPAALIVSLPLTCFQSSRALLDRHGDSAAVSERKLFARFGTTPPIGVQWDLVAATVTLALMIPAAGAVFVESRAWWKVLIFVVGSAVAIVGLCWRGSRRSLREPITRQRLALVTAVAAAAAFGFTFYLDDIAKYEGPGFAVGPPVIKSESISAADFVDADSYSSPAEMFDEMNLDGYLRKAGKAPTESAREDVLGVSIAYSGTNTARALSCNCWVLATLHSAADRSALSGPWSQTLWRLTTLSNYQEIGGNVWVPRPTVKGDYFVRLEIAEKLFVTDRSLLLKNREHNRGEAVVRLDDDGDVNKLWWVEYRPLDIVDTPVFTVG